MESISELPIALAHVGISCSVMRMWGWACGQFLVFQIIAVKNRAGASGEMRFSLHREREKKEEQ